MQSWQPKLGYGVGVLFRAWVAWRRHRASSRQHSWCWSSHRISTVRNTRELQACSWETVLAQLGRMGEAEAHAERAWPWPSR